METTEELRDSSADEPKRDEVDDSQVAALTENSSSEKKFKTALAAANLATLNEAKEMLRDLDDSRAEHQAIDNQIAKLTKTLPVEQRVVGETHKVVFTREQIAQHASDLARTLPEIERIEAELSSIKSQFKSKIEEQQARAKKLSAYVRDGFWYTEVRVQIRKDFKAGTFTKTRLDTGEVLEERQLYSEERQRGLGI